MAEVYTNLGASTLNGAITGGDLTLTVLNATTFPATGNFRVRLDDGVNVEICNVTGVAGAVFTITRAVSPTTAHNFASGTPVIEVQTKESVDAIRADQIQAGVYGSTPAAAGTKAGDLYLATDGLVAQKSTGAAWLPFGPLQPLTTPPTSSNWTWVNQGGAAMTDDGGYLTLAVPTSGSTAWRLITRTRGALTKVTAALMVNVEGANYSDVGIGFYDGANKFEGVQLDCEGGVYKVGVVRWTNVTTYSANVGANSPPIFVGPLLWLQMEYASSTLYFRISADGKYWRLVASELLSAFLTTADSFYLGGQTSSSPAGTSYIHLLSWLEA